MKSVVFATACLGVIVSLVACSGTSERRSGRNGGAGGDEYSAGGDSSTRGGSQSRAGQSSGGDGDGGTGATGGVSGGAGSVEGGVGGASAGSGTGDGGSSEGGASEGGTPGVGGEGGTSAEAGAGGVSQGGTGQVDSGGAGGEGGGSVHVDPVCGVNMVQVGAYSLWCGKVNMHQKEDGSWIHDADCSSGCNVNGIAYCKKFYPTATAVVAVDQTMSVVKDWKNAGCFDSAPDGRGISGEAACCAPFPVE